MSANVVSILNMKGGVGKTTLAVNLAWVLSELKHKKILLVDLDPQFNTSQYMLQYRDYEAHLDNKYTVLDIFLNPFKTTGPGPKKKRKLEPKEFMIRKHNDILGGILDLIPSQIELSGFVKSPGTAHGNLSDFIDIIEGNYDYILLDCAPTESILTTAAFTASNYILTPVTPDPFSIIGFSLIEESVKEFKGIYADKKNVQIIGSIFTNVEEDVTTQVSKDAIIEASPYTFESEMKWTRYYRHSVKDKVPLYRVPRCKTQFKTDLNMIAEEFIALLED